MENIIFCAVYDSDLRHERVNPIKGIFVWSDLSWNIGEITPKFQ